MNGRLSGVLCATLLLSGCDAVLTTAQLSPVKEDGILGEWKDLGVRGSTPDPDPVVIRFTNGEYWVGSAAQFTKGEASAFTLSRVGAALIVQSAGKDQCVALGAEKAAPCWSLNRVELLPDHLNWYEFDAERMGRDSFNGSMNVAHSVRREFKKDGNSNNSVLISADLPDLKSFLESYVKRQSVFRLTGRLQRIR
jgi:hypothetical protein